MTPCARSAWEKTTNTKGGGGMSLALSCWDRSVPVESGQVLFEVPAPKTLHTVEKWLVYLEDGIA
jgi:hypothetical protein